MTTMPGISVSTISISRQSSQAMASSAPNTTMALSSMTGFARGHGVSGSYAWAWEVKSVNGKGLDLRLRLPPGLDALEPGLREALGKRLKRGNVTANLTIKRDEQPRLAPDPAALE